MLSWPIWVGATFVWLVEISAPVSIVLVIIALISVNLWVFNLLPIPALDGGRIVTTTIYSLTVQFFERWSHQFMRFEKYFHAIGFILLMILTLYVAWLDISRFF
jgi:regulator of sigma E protease